MLATRSFCRLVMYLRFLPHIARITALSHHIDGEKNRRGNVCFTMYRCIRCKFCTVVAQEGLATVAPLKSSTCTCIVIHTWLYRWIFATAHKLGCTTTGCVARFLSKCWLYMKKSSQLFTPASKQPMTSDVFLSELSKAPFFIRLFFLSLSNSLLFFLQMCILYDDRNVPLNFFARVERERSKDACRWPSELFNLPYQLISYYLLRGRSRHCM